MHAESHRQQNEDFEVKDETNMRTRIEKLRLFGETFG